MSTAPADLLPPSATKQERALSQAVARAGQVPVEIRKVWSPQTCPAGMLPWLAWSLSVDDWDPTWTEQQKRDTIAASVEIHRHKGTIGALRRALGALGYDIVVDEQTGTPYTFALEVSVGPEGMNGSVWDQAERTALAAKNARSHLLGITAVGRVPGEALIQSAVISGEETQVWPVVVELLEGTAVARVLCDTQTADFCSVMPTYDDYFVAAVNAGGVDALEDAVSGLDTLINVTWPGLPF